MTAEERRAAAATLLRDCAALRMPIHGNSMLPSLREPMVLQIGAVRGVRIGDVLVFLRGETHVAHRVVDFEDGGFVTSGDAQPGAVERVPAATIVGRVVAVWSDASSDARRVDGLAHRVRAWYFARFHPLRSRAARLREKIADLAIRAQPPRRSRAIPGLVEAVAAAVREEPERLARALASNGGQWQHVDVRHRCAAVLGEAARRHGIVDRLPFDIAALLRRSRLQSILGASRMQHAVCAAVEILRETGVPFALLKGAARVYSGAPEAAYHPSDDIDVLVPESDVDRVVAALRQRGYRYVDDEVSVRRFRRRHHHAASLFPPDGQFPIEVHHALAPPRSLSIATDWAAVTRFLAPVAGSAGPVLQLDAVGTALHLAVHAIGLERLRDVALLAGSLRRLKPHEIAALRALVEAERRDRVRLEAPLALAARIAGVDWPVDRMVDQYLYWALRREDLPSRLRMRCGAAEAYFAHPERRWVAWRGLVPWWSRGGQMLAVLPRIVARCFSNLAAVLYARMLTDDDRGTIK